MYTPTPLFLTAVPELTEHQISHVYPLGDGYASSDEEEQPKDIQEGDEEETDEIAAADDVDGKANFHAGGGDWQIFMRGRGLTMTGKQRMETARLIKMKTRKTGMLTKHQRRQQEKVRLRPWVESYELLSWCKEVYSLYNY